MSEEVWELCARHIMLGLSCDSERRREAHNIILMRKPFFATSGFGCVKLLMGLIDPLQNLIACLRRIMRLAMKHISKLVIDQSE